MKERKGGMYMFNVKRILVPTDFSQYSDMALQKAVDIASENNAKVVLLHVIDESVQQCVVDYCLSNEIIAQLESESVTVTRDRMQREVSSLKKDKPIEIDFDIRKGAPAAAILEEQQQKGIDLIVIPSHGKSGILKHLIGGVTDKVVRAAKCPVMVVRA
jgi:nucleotide-binding universal stress UspA family protein